MNANNVVLFITIYNHLSEPTTFAKEILQLYFPDYKHP
jgi:hypothetical protein